MKTSRELKRVWVWWLIILILLSKFKHETLNRKKRRAAEAKSTVKATARKTVCWFWCVFGRNMTTVRQSKLCFSSFFSSVHPQDSKNWIAFYDLSNPDSESWPGERHSESVTVHKQLIFSLMALFADWDVFITSKKLLIFGGNVTLAAL